MTDRNCSFDNGTVCLKSPNPVMLSAARVRRSGRAEAFRREISPAVPYVQNVAILHDVIFSFQPQLALGAGVGLGSGFQQRVPVDGFRADEMLLQVGMDGA